MDFSNKIDDLFVLVIIFAFLLAIYFFLHYAKDIIFKQKSENSQKP